MHTSGTSEFAVYLHHAGVAGLNRPQLRVIADLGQVQSNTIDRIDQPLSFYSFVPGPVDGDLNHC